MPHDGQTQGPRGWPNILGLLRATNLKVIGKTGATAGAGLAGGTTSGAPTSGSFDVGDGVFGQDGSLWICTVAGSPGTFVQAGFANPMTASGDLIAGGASGVAQRLTVGSNGQVLTVSAGAPAWGAAGAGSGGALTQISDQSVSGSAAANVTFSSIAGSYTGLLLHVSAATNAGSNPVALQLQFNSDTGSTYDWADVNFGAAASGDTAQADTKIVLAQLPGTAAPSGRAGGCTVTIPDYAGTTFHKTVISPSWVNWTNSGTTNQPRYYAGDWRNTAAITSIILVPASGSFLVGSRFTLYGVL